MLTALGVPLTLVQPCTLHESQGQVAQSQGNKAYSPERERDFPKSIETKQESEDPGKPNSALGLFCQVFINPAGVASDTLGGWGGGQRPDSAYPGLASLAGDTAEILHLQPTHACSAAPPQAQHRSNQRPFHSSTPPQPQGHR